MSEFLRSLGKLSAAEEFLDFLGVDYDPKIVQVNRLHILKRFHDYMGKTPLPEGGRDEDIRVACAGLLQKAYLDFVDSSAVQQKVFPVFHKQAQKNGRAFVALEKIER